MGQYTKKGLLNGYKKNNTERAAYDYYATPAVEVENILNTLYEYFGYNYSDKVILEPCVGGGHMADGIDKYLIDHNQYPKEKIAEDYIDRGWRGWQWKTRYGEDFLDDNYESCDPDVIIMNPPYSTIEPFLIRALDLNPQYLIVLCRTQVLEGASRWEKIFQDGPPSYVFQYSERIQCWKNGKKPAGSSAQAYCWLVWNKDLKGKNTELFWIHRSEKY